jgi:hypothetical protein
MYFVVLLKNLAMKILNLLAFVVMIVMNFLANALPLNERTTGEISARYDNLFTPAGFTFSIWSVIYLLVLIFIILQFRSEYKNIVSDIGWAFVLSSVFNALWIVAWHYDRLPVSLVLMLLLLGSLLYINMQFTRETPAIFRAAFGIYLGWICIATIANITVLLVAFNWGGWAIADKVWAIIAIGAGVIITSWALVRLDNPFLALAVIWAFIGIIAKRHADYPSIAIAAAVGIAIMAIVMIMAYRQVFPQQA